MPDEYNYFNDEPVEAEEQRAVPMWETTTEAEAFNAPAETPSAYIEDRSIIPAIQNNDTLLLDFPALRDNINKARSQGLSDSEIRGILAESEMNNGYQMTSEELDNLYGRTKETRTWSDRVYERQGIEEISKLTGLKEDDIRERNLVADKLGLSRSTMMDNEVYKAARDQVKVIDDFITAGIDAAKAVSLNQQASRLIYETMGRDMTPEEQAQLDAINKEIAKYSNVVYTGKVSDIAASATNLLAQQAYGVAQGADKFFYYLAATTAANAAWGAGAGAMLGPGGTAAMLVKSTGEAFSATALHGAFENSTRLEATGIYQEILQDDAGIDKKTAKYIAMVGGTLNGYIEVGNIATMLKLFPGAKSLGGVMDRFLKGGAAQVIKDNGGMRTLLAAPSMRRALVDTLKDYVSGVKSETMEEIQQAIVSTIIIEVSKRMKGREYEFSLDKPFSSIKEGFFFTKDFLAGLYDVMTEGKTYRKVSREALKTAIEAGPQMAKGMLPGALFNGVGAVASTYHANKVARASRAGGPVLTGQQTVFTDPAAQARAEVIQTAQRQNIRTAEVKTSSGTAPTGESTATAASTAQTTQAETAAPQIVQTVAPQATAEVKTSSGTEPEAAATPETADIASDIITPEPAVAETPAAPEAAPETAAESEVQDALDADAVFVNSDALDTFMQDLPETEQAALRDLLGWKNVRKVEATGEYYISGEKFREATKQVQGLNNAVGMDVRNGIEGSTLRERTDAMATMRRLGADPMEGDEPFAKEAQNIRDDLVERLKQGGQSETLARANADLLSHFFYGFARRNGMDVDGRLREGAPGPETFYGKFRLEFPGRESGITGTAAAQQIADSNNGVFNQEILTPQDYDENGNVRPEVVQDIIAEIAGIRADAQLDGTYLQAPNGNKSNLAPGVWEMVRTERFQKWFGNSQVVDENGEPKVVYHGTPRGGFTVFDTNGTHKTADAGAFFSDRRAIASTYASGRTEMVAPQFDENGNVIVDEYSEEIPLDDEHVIYPVFLKIEHPYVVDAQGKNWENVGEITITDTDYSSEIYEKADGAPFMNEDDAWDYIEKELDDPNHENYMVSPAGEMTTDEIARAVYAGDYGTEYPSGAPYDGVIFQNVIDEGPAGRGYSDESTVYSIPTPEQIKSVDNRGTFDSSANIYHQAAAPRTQDQTQTPEFKRWFGDSKVVDENGKPLVMYHGTPRGGFDSFRTEQGAFFTVKGLAERYTIDRETGEFPKTGQIYPAYLRIENPLDLREWGRRLPSYRNAATMEPALENSLRNIFSKSGITDKQLAEANKAAGIHEGRDGNPFDDLLRYLNMEDSHSANDVPEGFIGAGYSEHLDKKLKAVLESLGFDGIRFVENSIRHDGDEAFVVFHPNQIKSVDNRGTFDTGENIFYQDAANITKLTPQERTVWDEASPGLTEKERLRIESGNVTSARNFINAFGVMPGIDEYAAAALAGRAKKGWYARSAVALQAVFGEDTDRFTALLAATSPQCSVETNLMNALKVWKAWGEWAQQHPGWEQLDDVEKRRAVIQVMRANVQQADMVEDDGDQNASKKKKKKKESQTDEATGEKLGPVLDAWINNTIRALTETAPTETLLSGPKVDSFMRNLRGDLSYVTNDTWMAKSIGRLQSIFGGNEYKPEKADPGYSLSYLAMNAKVRLAAEALTQLTGEKWEPAEVQETIWSWAKTISDYAKNLAKIQSKEYNESNKAPSFREIIESGAISDEMVGSTVDFAQLFTQGDGKNDYRTVLEEAGYGEQLEKLDAEIAARDAAGRGSESSDDAGSVRLAHAPGLEALAGGRDALARVADRLEAQTRGESEIHKKLLAVRSQFGSFFGSRDAYADGYQNGGDLSYKDERRQPDATQGFPAPYKVNRGREESGRHDRSGGYVEFDLGLKNPVKVKATEYVLDRGVAVSLKEAFAATPRFYELAMDEKNIAKSASAFRRALIRGQKSQGPWGLCVEVKSLKTYMNQSEDPEAPKIARLVLTEGARAGFAVDENGGIVSAFSMKGAPLVDGKELKANKDGQFPRVVPSILMLAVQMGGRHMDCFDTVLPGAYSSMGFRAVSRCAFSWEYRPTGWTTKTTKLYGAFNNGSPDVVFLVYDPNYTSLYKRGEGVMCSDYGAASKVVTQEIANLREQSQALRQQPAQTFNRDAVNTSYQEPVGSSNEYNQDQQQEPRGSIRFDEKTGESIVSLFKSADESTFMHESAHMMLHMMLQFGRGENAAPLVAQDLDVVLDFLGMKDFDFDHVETSEQQARLREAHEKFARTWELYLMSGKAPTTFLQKVFAKMKRWLLNIYFHARHLNTELTPAVQEVFDRMLAAPVQEEGADMTLQDLQSETEAADAAIARMETVAEQAQEEQAAEPVIEEEPAQPKTPKDKISALKEKQKEKISALRERQKERIAALKEQQRQRIAALREANAARIAKIFQRISELKARQKERAALKKEIAKLLKKINKAAEQKSIIWAAKQEIEELLNGYTLKNPSNQRMEQAKNLYTYLADNPDVDFDSLSPQEQRDVNMLGTTMLPDMTLGELRALAQKVEDIRARGREEYKQWEEEKRTRRTGMFNECFTALGDIPSTEGKVIRGPQDLRKEYKGIRGKLEQAGDWTYAATLNSHRLFDWIGNGHGLFKSAWTKYFVEAVNTAHDEYLRNANDRRERIEAVLQENGLTLRDLSHSRVIDGQQYTVDEMLSVYALLQNEKGAKALLFGNFKGLPDAQAHAAHIVQALTPQELNVANAVLQDYEDSFDRLNQCFIAVYKEGMVKEEHYSPMKRLEYTSNEGVVDAEDAEVLAGRTAAAGMRASLEKGFLHKRMEISEANQQPVDLGLLSIWNEQVTAQEHTAAFAQLAGDLSSVLHQRDEATGASMAKAIRLTKGSEAWQSVTGYTNLVIMNEARAAHNVLNKLSSTLGRNMSMVYLAGSISVYLKQWMSLPRFVLSAGSQLLTATYQYLTHPKQFMAEVYKLDPQIKERLPNAFYKLTKIDPTTAGKWGYLSEETVQKLMLLGAYQDRVTAAIGWKAVYDSNIKRGLSQKEAIHAAQRAVALTQQVPNLKDMPAFWRQSGLAKLMMIFSSNSVPLWGMTAYDLAQAIKRGSVPKSFRTIMALTAAALGTALVVSGPPSGDDDDTFLDWFLDAMAEQTITSLPVIGKEIYAAWDEIINKNRRGSTYSALVTPFVKSAQGVKRMMADDNDSVMRSGMTKFEAGAWQAAEGLGLLLGNLPITMVRRFWQAAVHDEDGWQALQTLCAIRRSQKQISKAVSW